MEVKKESEKVEKKVEEQEEQRNKSPTKMIEIEDIIE